ncbi:hypothetical protein [Streptomyces sp. NPDC059076]|uniref:hypothetical protein n=1 Tax=unclassified Streptomyces TaxID=2593676 RepID=UPI00368282F2
MFRRFSRPYGARQGGRRQRAGEDAMDAWWSMGATHFTARRRSRRLTPTRRTTVVIGITVRAVTVGTHLAVSPSSR